MKLAAVVVFYKPSEDNIKYINEYRDVVDKIYVIDNTEDSIIRIKNDSKIDYVKYNENKGIAHALNDGAKRAIKDGYHWLLTMDQDSKITSSNINDMISFLDKHKTEKDIGLISPYQDIQSNVIISDVEYDDVIEIMTSGNIINLDAYKNIGGWKDWLFIDCVDTDYCMNLHKHGYRVLRLNKVIMEHNLGNRTFHKLFGKVYDCSNHNAIRRYYIMRNNWYIYDIYHNIYPDYCNKLKRIQKGQIKRIIIFEKNKLKKVINIIKGYNDYKKGIKGKMKSRG